MQQNSHVEPIGEKIIIKYKITLIAVALLISGVLCILFSRQAQAVSKELEQLLLTIGTGLIPSALITLIFEFSLRDSFLKAMKEQLNKVISKNFERVNNLNNSGIIDIHNRIPIDRLENVFGNSKKEIKILQTWIPEVQSLQRHFRNVIQSQGQVRILLLDPNSVLAGYRNRNLGFDENKNQVSLKIEDTIETLKVFYRTLKDKDEKLGKFIIKVYDFPYSFCLYSGDSHSFTGWYWVNHLTSETCHLELINNQSELSNLMSEHFDYLWENSKEVALD